MIEVTLKCVEVTPDDEDAMQGFPLPSRCSPNGRRTTGLKRIIPNDSRNLAGPQSRTRRITEEVGAAEVLTSELQRTYTTLPIVQPTCDTCSSLLLLLLHVAGTALGLLLYWNSPWRRHHYGEQIVLAGQLLKRGEV